MGRVYSVQVKSYTIHAEKCGVPPGAIRAVSNHEQRPFFPEISNPISFVYWSTFSTQVPGYISVPIYTKPLLIHRVSTPPLTKMTFTIRRHYIDKVSHLAGYSLYELNLVDSWQGGASGDADQ